MKKILNSINMIQRITHLALVYILLSAISLGYSQSIQITTTVIPPISPYLPELTAKMQGGGGNLSITDKLIVTVRNTTNAYQEIKINGAIERQYPDMASIKLRPDYHPTMSIKLFPQQQITLTKKQLEEAFGQFYESELLFDNIDLQKMRLDGANYKLPEGGYRICFTAYDIDDNISAQPLSTSFGSNCAMFNVCYSIAASQFTSPWTSYVDDAYFQDFTPFTNQIRFDWSTPATTCNFATGLVNYHFEIRKLMPGQAISDYNYAPIVYQTDPYGPESYPNYTIINMDLHPNVLENGQKYMARVKATLNIPPNSPVEIVNNGYSEILTFTYRTSNDETPGEVAPPTPLPMTIDVSNVCPDIPGINDASPIFSGNLVEGDEVRIGAFTMIVKSATKNGDKYTGKGEIKWKPYGAQLLLAVNFTDIKINQDKELIEGSALTTWDKSLPGDEKFLNMDLGGFMNNMGNLQEDYFDPINQKINQVGHYLHQLTGSAPVDFPLGLNNQELGNSNMTLAIMGIAFTKEGTDMRMLFNLNMPDAGVANQWLSLAGAKFCIKPDGFSFSNGLLFLPSDRTINLGGETFTLHGAQSSDNTFESIDTTATTYLKWTASNGLDKIFVKADVTLPNELKAVDPDTHEPTGEKVKLVATFSFKKWDNWIASLSTNAPFEIDGLDGFIINPTKGIYYDHSATTNPAPINNLSSSSDKWPTNDATHTFKGKNNTYQGFYMEELVMTLPNTLVKPESGTMPTISFNNLFINGENGLWASIQANNLLKKGYIGDDKNSGWGASIDVISIPIKNSLPQSATMTGKLKLPVSKDELGYTCNLSISSEGVGFEFAVGTTTDYNIKMWAASLKLQPNTNISISKQPGKSTVLAANISAKMDITVSEQSPRLAFTALTIENMVIANRNPTTNENKFYFDPGNIQFGLLNALPPSTSTGYFNPYYEEERDFNNAAPEYLLASGPSAPAYFPAGGGGSTSSEPVAGSNISGFGVLLKNFAPVIDMLDDRKIGFKFTVGLNLGFGPVKLNNETTLAIYGQLKDLKNPPTNFELDVKKITIDGDFGPVKVKGELEFRKKDATWGDGILGNCKVAFPPGINIDADIVFGQVNNYSYYGFGASVYSAAGLIPIGPVVITGFGGGFYNNIKLTTTEASGTTPGKVTMTPESGAMTFKASVSLSYLSATVMKATATLTTSISGSGGISMMQIKGNADFISAGGKDDEGIVNAKIDMTYDFEHDVFDLYAKVTAGVGSVKSGTEDGLSMAGPSMSIPIWMHAGYNQGVKPANETLEQQKARQNNKKNFDFWLYVGRPDKGADTKGNPFEKIEVTLMKLNTPFLKVDIGGSAYFCIGSELPPFPALPSVVTNALQMNNNKDTYNNSVLSKIKNGAGFMFGAEIHGSINASIAIFYLDIAATLGFDVALKHYTSNPCGNTPIGLEGWYANGQLYAYFSADAGFEIDLWFWSGKVSLVKLSLGAVLQAGLPNPTWAEGRIRITGEVLGGLIRINTGCDFAINKEQKCEVKGNPLDDIEMITEVGPAGDEVDIFAYPYVVFSMPMMPAESISTPSKIVKLEVDEHTTRSYKFFIKETSVRYASGSKYEKEVPGITTSLSPDGYTLTLIKTKAFDKKTKFNIYVKCGALELKNGQWKTPTGFTNTTKYPEGFVQDSLLTIMSGNAPDSISEKNIAYSYPVLGQRYLLKNEFNRKGVVRIFQWVDDYFELEGKTPKYMVDYVSMDGTSTFSTPFTPNIVNGTMDFTIPSGLQNGKQYMVYFTVQDANYASTSGTKTTKTRDIDLLKKSSISPGDLSSGVKIPIGPLYPKMPTSGFSTQVDNVTKEQDSIMLLGHASSTFQPTSGRIIYMTTFGVSQYNTFKAKMESYGNTCYTSEGTKYTSSVRKFDISKFEDNGKKYTGNIWAPYQDFSYYDYNIDLDQGPEGFDIFEVRGQERVLVGGVHYIVPPLFQAGIKKEESLTNDLQMKKSIYNPIKSTFQYTYYDNYANFGYPQNREDISNGQWPKYAFTFEKTIINQPYSLKNSSYSSNSSSNSNIYLFLPFETKNLVMTFTRDKMYAEDYALLKKAAWCFYFLKPDIDLINTLHQTFDLGFWFNYYYNLKGVPLSDAVDLAFLKVQKQDLEFQQMLNDWRVLATGNGGASFKIPAGKEMAFWGLDSNFKTYYENIAIRMRGFATMFFTPFNTAQNRTIEFTYGYNSLDTRWFNNGLYPNGEFKSTLYPIVDLYKVKVTKPMKKNLQIVGLDAPPNAGNQSGTFHPIIIGF
ncbi:MAG: hypothetical protein M9897_10990 [Brumimicrobium sp.]|nr:hypothetical protein [Brumimicrobium sp.]